MREELYFIDIIYKYTVDYRPQKRMTSHSSGPGFTVRGALYLVAHVMGIQAMYNNTVFLLN